MVELNAICKRRKIYSLDIDTPLLIPSFSSKIKGLEGVNINEIHTRMTEYLYEVSLVSAYDLYHRQIDILNLNCSDILFIDSGGYEKRCDDKLFSILEGEFKILDWNEKLHVEQISKVKPFSKIVIIYDSYGPVGEQLEKSKNFFNNFPNYCYNFLIKPISENEKVNIQECIENIKELIKFPVIGFTEKELGDSVQKRCENLFIFRNKLNEEGSDTPIHVFGCLDPLNILAYYLCGADIFDGLVWIRFSFNEGLALYNNSQRIINGKWARSDKTNELFWLINNLLILSDLKTKMNLFSRSYDWNDFNISTNACNQLQTLIRSVGIII